MPLVRLKWPLEIEHLGDLSLASFCQNRQHSHLQFTMHVSPQWRVIRQGGGGGACLIALYKFTLLLLLLLHKSLCEKHPNRGWSDRSYDTQSSLNSTPFVCTGVSLPNVLPFPRIVRGPVQGDLWFWLPLLHIFLFSIPLTRYARHAPGTGAVAKKIPFLRVF